MEVNQRQQRRIVGQRVQLGDIAETGAPAPGDDALELRDLLARGEPRLAAGLLQAVLAQVVGTALQQRTAQAHAQRRPHARQIAVVELVLQRAGAGGDDGLQPRQQRRHQIRIGLAGAGAGLGQQHVALLERLGDRRGQPQLRRPRHERIELARKRTAFAERFGACVS